MKLFGLEVHWGRPAAVAAAAWAPEAAPAAAPAPPEPTRFLGDLVRLELKDGDVCVLMMPGRISDEASARMREAWATAVGENVSLLVIDGGGRLGILSPGQAGLAALAIADGRAVSAAVGE